MTITQTPGPVGAAATPLAGPGFDKGAGPTHPGNPRPSSPPRPTKYGHLPIGAEGHDPDKPHPTPMPLPPPPPAPVYADPFAYSSPGPCCLMCKPFISG